MNAFIINLSNIFDFDISMPVLSSLIAEKKVWMSKESGTFPVNPSEALVFSRLFEFFNKYEHRRITLDVDKPNLKTEVYFVLGYEEWEFLPYGRMNAYPYFKMEYLLEELSRLFKKSVTAFPFKIRFFLTRQMNSEKHDFFGTIEEKGYADDDSPYWFSANLLEKEMSVNEEIRKSFYAGKKGDDPINEDMRKGIEKYAERFLIQLKHFASSAEIEVAIIEKWNKLFRTKLNNIKTVGQFSEVVNSPVPLLKNFLYENFALQAKIAKLPPAYKFSIDTSSASSGLRSKFEFGQFITQFIMDSFLEEKNKLYQVESVQINTDALAPVLSRLSGTINRYSKNTVDLQKEEHYHVYSVNESYYRNLPVISNEDRNKYVNLGFLRNVMGWFYNRAKKEKVQRAFENNSYTDLEKKMPVETGSFSSLLKDALNKQMKSIPVSMIPSEIARFEESAVSSAIDFQQYAVKRDELLRKQDEKFEELLHLMPALPLRPNFWYSIAIVLIVMLLFAVPVFVWEHWDNAAMFFPIFTIGVAAAVAFALHNEKQKIENKIQELEEVRALLANNLVSHCANIKEAATRMANAYAKRETLKDLKKIRQKYDEQSYRALAYEKYHHINQENISLLCKIYGITLSQSDMTRMNVSFEKHPADDTNLITEPVLHDLDIIINKQQTIKKNVKTLLKKIEIRSN